MAKHWARICRDLIASERLMMLLEVNPFAEALYWRLKAMSDDYGRYYGTAAEVATGCCPRNIIRRSFRLAKVEKALADLEATGCVVFYEVEGRRYLEIADYLAHAHTQWTHVGRPEYPTPPGWIAPTSLVRWLLTFGDARNVTPDRYGVTRDNWPPGIRYPFEDTDNAPHRLDSDSTSDSDSQDRETRGARARNPLPEDLHLQACNSPLHAAAYHYWTHNGTPPLGLLGWCAAFVVYARNAGVVRTLTEDQLLEAFRVSPPRAGEYPDAWLARLCRDADRAARAAAQAPGNMPAPRSRFRKEVTGDADRPPTDPDA